VTAKSDAAVAEWEQRGHLIPTEVGDVFCVDIDGPADRPPALVIHGYPSSSFDWWGVVDALAADRRVVLFDLLGFGLSAKPDRPYGIRVQADVTQAVAAAHGLEQVVLITHDLGDTVGGEVLARSLEGSLDFDIAGRLLTNGSIYIDMAHLTNGQQLLLSLPDEKLAPGLITAESYTRALADTMSSGHQPTDDELAAQWELSSRDDGHLLLARLIRYIEERRREERRFTGAIETHPSPLAVLWGVEDPIAIVAMVDQLLAARPDANVVRLAGLAHYPMIEDPAGFGAEAARLLRAVDGA
jgi:pimeloyl-ACP methyl ester carboxylesterase